MTEVPMPSDAPKKYIRTLEGDIETLKQGGKPDLAPLPERAPVERLIEASPVPPPTPLAKSASPPLAPQPPPRPTGPSPIETYSADFSTRVKDTGASTATVLAAEQDAAKEAPAKEAPARGRSGLLYTLAGVLLLVVGGGSTYYIYTNYMVSGAPVALTPVIAAPIFVDERAEVDGSGAALAQSIVQSVSRSVAAGAVRLLSLAGATTTDRSVFSALQLPAPDVLLRNINASGSIAGIVNVSGMQSPFFILSVASYGETFAGMLSWEVHLPRDLGLFFPPYPAPVVATTTATATAPAALGTSGFRDVVVANHDTRIYRDSFARTILVYGYWDQRTLIIARDEAAFTEILRRLATSRSSQ
ncbi:hypothetical protein HY091_01570 [Candidatus Kaiserbacteria bacterium]|nr:hypothetical protein [Candidatus Kaiserbacteria bacterium]